MICSAISKVANVGWAKEYSWWLISCPLWGVGSIALLMFAVVYLVGRYEAKRMEREEDFFRGI